MLIWLKQTDRKVTVLIIINTIFFLTISLLHFYWAAGGTYGNLVVLPSKTDGQFVFKPGIFSTIIVAVGLLLFAVITLGNLGIFDHWIERKYPQGSTWVIAGIFIARAIGDFNFVGFGKRIRDTPFARNDTRIYSPLSLSVGVISLLIALFAD